MTTTPTAPVPAYKPRCAQALQVLLSELQARGFEIAWQYADDLSVTYINTQTIRTGGQPRPNWPYITLNIGADSTLRVDQRTGRGDVVVPNAPVMKLEPNTKPTEVAAYLRPFFQRAVGEIVLAGI